MSTRSDMPESDIKIDVAGTDYTPEKGTYNQTGTFRFWSQKVLPLVYDDSLSYYELLCKVVNYLNSVIQNVDTLNAAVDSTNSNFSNLQTHVNTSFDKVITAFNTLQDYTNNYFTSLDVQEEINTKLDAMAADGSLSNILVETGTIQATVTTWLNENITPTTPAVDDTLTISGAAADAQITGIHAETLKRAAQNAYTDAFDNSLLFPSHFGQCFVMYNNAINTSAPQKNAEYNALVTDCAEGDSFIIYATGGTSTYAWLFIDSDGNVLTRSASNAVVTGQKITAPTLTAHLVVNDKSKSMRVYAKQPNYIFNDITNALAYKAAANVFYITDGGEYYWSKYGTTPIVLTVSPKNLILRIKGTSRTITRTEIISACESIGLNTTDNTISGNTYCIYYDTDEDIIKATNETAKYNVVQSKFPIIFFAHYNSIRCGLVVDYMAGKRLDALDTNYSTLESTIAGMQSQIDDALDVYNIPTYYESHISAKIGDIQSAMNGVGKQGETFIFITDIHWENNNKNSPALVHYLLDNLNIHNLICGGDLINQGTKANMIRTMRECVTAFQHKNLFMPIVYGNHDNNANGTAASDHFTVAEQYALMQKQAEKLVTYFTDTNYANQNWNFYWDIVNTKTRFICIDTSNNGTYNRFTQLAQILNDTPENYSVILIAHWLLQNGTKTAVAGYLSDLCDAANARQVVTIPSKGTFDMTNSKCTVRMILSGHAHYDDAWYSTGGIPVLVCDSDNGPRSNNTDKPYVSGTITEQSFSSLTIDYTTGLVIDNRIGRGYNRIVHAGIIDMTSSTTYTLTAAHDNATWTSSDTAIATVADGIITKVTSGACIISAHADDTTEFWLINT